MTHFTQCLTTILVCMCATLLTGCPYVPYLGKDRCGFEGDGPFFLGQMETPERFEQFTGKCASVEVFEASGFQGGGGQHIEPAILVRDAAIPAPELDGVVTWSVFQDGGALTSGTQEEIFSSAWRDVEKGLVYEPGRVQISLSPSSGTQLRVEALIEFEDGSRGDVHLSETVEVE